MFSQKVREIDIKMIKVVKFYIVVIILSAIFSGCATYHQQQKEFQNYFSYEDYSRADNWLDNHANQATGKNRLLHYFDRGTVAFHLEDPNKSIQYFTQADHYIEDYIKKMSLSALALISNPTVKPYQPENFEAVLLHFYQALNWFSLNKYEEALVEAKRINLRLNDLDDKYNGKNNKYKRDAFAHYLQGLIYESDNNYNDAFIAYRNAYNVYEEDYKKHFSMSAPAQLQEDLLFAAAQTGFNDEVDFYEKKLGLKYKKRAPKSELIVFWLNGMSPFKDETSFNFVKTRGSSGLVLKDPGNDLVFNFPTSGLSSKERNALGSSNIIRVAFPKYVERRPKYYDARIRTNDTVVESQLVEDVNAIAFKCLKDRMTREMSTALLRLAVKQSLKYAIQESTKAIGKDSKNEETMNLIGDGLGFLVGAVNAATEKADTRNWQTLPHSISIMRIPLKEGENNIVFEYGNGSNVQKEEFKIVAKGRKKYFKSIRTIK